MRIMLSWKEATSEVFACPPALESGICKCIGRDLPMSSRDSLIPADLHRLQNLINKGSLLKAKILCERLCRRESQDSRLWSMLGHIHGQLGNYENAIKYSQKSLSINRQDPDAFATLAFASLRTGRNQEAVRLYKEYIHINPDNPEVHENLGLIYKASGALHKAASCLERVITLKPLGIQAYLYLGDTYTRLGDAAKSEKIYRTALSLEPENSGLIIELAYVLQAQGKYTEAFSCFEKVFEIDKHNHDALIGMALVRHKQGYNEEAYHLITPLLDKQISNPRFAFLYARIARHLNKNAEAIQLIERTLASDNLGGHDKSLLHFCLGDIYDINADYNKAFQHYKVANNNVACNRDNDTYLVAMRAMRRIFTAELFSNMPTSGNNTELPVFIVGMPRSGTTLLEQILSSHSKIYGAGELSHLMEMADDCSKRQRGASPYDTFLQSLTRERLHDLSNKYTERLQALAPDASRITDKMPHNFMLLGFIALLFPESRVIHCSRNPLDTCLSIYFNTMSQGHEYAYSLESIGRHYREYVLLMKHWNECLPVKMLNIQYEDVVLDLEGQSRKIVGFCGLDWEDRCLDFVDNKRDVSTISYEQIRKPIYQSSIGRWKHYEAYLSSLINRLEES